jgi:hypothetical protein
MNRMRAYILLCKILAYKRIKILRTFVGTLAVLVEFNFNSLKSSCHVITHMNIVFNYYNLMILCVCVVDAKVLKKKLTHFATKSSKIMISSRIAGSTLQKRSLFYKTQTNKSKRKKKKIVFLISLIILNFLTQGFHDIQITTTKFC